MWEAARYLVNYEGMTNSIIKGQMEVHQAFWPKGFPGSYDEAPYSYDPAKAKQILEDAGIETPITVDLDVINAAPFTDMAQSLQASFADAGINFDIIPGTGSQVITKYRERSTKPCFCIGAQTLWTHTQTQKPLLITLTTQTIHMQRPQHGATHGPCLMS